MLRFPMIILAIMALVGCSPTRFEQKWPRTLEKGLAWEKGFVPLDAIESGKVPSGGREVPLEIWSPRDFPLLDDDAIGSHAGYWIELPQLDADFYELSLDFISAAYEAFLFPISHPDRAISFEVGHPGATEGAEIPFLKRQVVPFQVLDGEQWVLVVNMSNHARTYGGFWSPPQIAPRPILQTKRDLGLYLQYGITGSMLIIMLYTFMMFLRNRSDIPSLLLSLTCVTISMRLFGIENLLSNIYINVESSTLFRLNTRLEYLSMPFSTIALLHFLLATFPKVKIDRRLVIALDFVSISLIILTLSTNPQFFTRWVSVYQVNVMVHVCIMLILSIRAFRWKEPGAGYMLACAGIPFISSIIDVIQSHLGGSSYISHFAGALFIFMQSQVLAKRFAEAYHRAAHLSVHLQEEVEHQTLQIRNIMDNVPEGLFTIGQNLRIQGHCSKYVYSIFRLTSLSTDNVMDLLLHQTQFDRTALDMTESVLRAVIGEDEISWALNSAHLPEETLTVDGRSIELEWHPIIKEGIIVEILVIVRDITELKDLRLKTRYQEEEIILISELAQAKSFRLAAFLGQTAEITRTVRSVWEASSTDGDQSSIRLVLALLHTLKGNSRQIGFSVLARIVHEFEQNIIDLQKTHGEFGADFTLVVEMGLKRVDKQLDLINVLHTRYWGERGYANDKSMFEPEDITRLQAWVEGFDRRDDEIRALIKLRMNALLKEQLMEVQGELYRLANDLGKAPPKLIVSLPPDLWLNENAKSRLLNAMGHILRNSLDHGIEKPVEREHAGKDVCGSIHVMATRTQDSLRITVADDGVGLDLESIQRKANTLGCWRSSYSLAEKLSLVFVPGFSTSSGITEISGRGIGMDSVRQEVESIGGSVHIEARESYPGLLPRFVPFMVVIELPLSRLGFIAA